MFCVLVSFCLCGRDSRFNAAKLMKNFGNTDPC